MTFEQIANIFGGAAYIELKTEEILSSGINNVFVDIDKLPDSDIVFLRKKEKGGSALAAESFSCTPRTERDGAVLDRILKGFYLARIASTSAKTLGIQILALERPFTHEAAFEIALTEKSLSSSKETAKEIEKKIKQNYAFECCGKTYYIFAKFLAGDGVFNNRYGFSVIDGEHLIDVVLKRKGDIDSAAGDHAEDQIYVIVNGEKRFSKDRYRIFLAEADFLFCDMTSVSKAHRANVAFLNSGLDHYVSVWKNVCQLEYEFVLRQQGEAGCFPYEIVDQSGDEIQIAVHTEESRIDAFLRIFHDLTRSASDMRLELTGDLRYGQEEKQKRRFLLFIRRNGKTFYCRRLPKEDKRLPEHGQLCISIEGFKKQFFRRNAAIESIVLGHSAKPNLAMLLSGTGAMPPMRKRIPAESPELRDACFEGRAPQPAQLTAIEIALNTPDFAIIQGPPGTGKTRVINAIQFRLGQEDREKTIAFGRNLLTAYQREATRNLAERTETYGLPTPVQLGQTNGEREILEKNFKAWHEKMCQKLVALHPDIAQGVKRKKVIEDFSNIFARYNPSVYTYEKNEAELMLLQTTLQEEFFPEEFVFKAESFLQEAKIHLKQRFGAFLPVEFYCAKNIPTNPVSYGDGGKELVATVIRQLNGFNGIEEALGELEHCFEGQTINFERVAELKNEILSKMIPQNNLIIPKVYNEKVYAFLQEIQNWITEAEETQEEHILSDYIQAFLYDEIQIRSAIDKFQTVIAATHQKSVDKTITDKKKIGEASDEDDEFPEYENILVDEAARSCPPDLLIPMNCARDRIILVGDHKQLPQFVSDKIYDLVESQTSKTDEAIREEREVIRETLFERLIEQARKLSEKDGYPRFITLDTQYRMKKILGDFVSRNFYEQDGVKIKSPLPDSNFTHSLPGLENKAMVFMDVRGGDDRPEANGGYTRRVEAVRIAGYFKKIVASPAWKNTEMTFGIISFYREQLNAIRKELAAPEIEICEGTEYGYKIKQEYEKRIKIDTVDAFQGLECDVVILSMTRSNSKGKFGFIEKDRVGSLKSLNGLNRLCVALSRQKRCLIVVGDGAMLERKDAADRVPALVDFYKTCKQEVVEGATV